MSFKSWSAKQSASNDKKNSDEPDANPVIGMVIDQPTVPVDETPGVSKPAPKP